MLISAFTRVFNALCRYAMTIQRSTAIEPRPHAVATGRAAAKNFLWKRGTPPEVAHWCWRNELYDPLSSFVPELEPRRRRGFSFGSGLTGGSRGPDRVGAVTVRSGIPRSMALARPGLRRVAGIDVGRSFLFALFRHHRRARAALLAAPAEPLLRDVVLARPAIFPSLTDEGLLANGLSHSLRPCELRRCACRGYAGTCAHSYPARAAADRGVGWRMHRFAAARLCGGIPSIHVCQCRVPPSPPAIRDMKKPRLRIRRGFDFSLSRLRD